MTEDKEVEEWYKKEKEKSNSGSALGLLGTDFLKEGLEKKRKQLEKLGQDEEFSETVEGLEAELMKQTQIYTEVLEIMKKIEVQKEKALEEFQQKMKDFDKRLEALYDEKRKEIEDLQKRLKEAIKDYEKEVKEYRKERNRYIKKSDFLDKEIARHNQVIDEYNEILRKLNNEAIDETEGSMKGRY